MNIYQAISLFFLINIINVAYAEEGEVKCYTCNELEDKSCGDPYEKNDKHLQVCSKDYEFCRKTMQNVEGDKSIIRQCAHELYKPNYEGCYKTAGKSTQNVCTCKGLGCNSGVFTKSSALSIVIAAIIALFFF